MLGQAIGATGGDPIRVVHSGFVLLRGSYDLFIRATPTTKLFESQSKTKIDPTTPLLEI
jgi:hypothetical protein